LIFETLKSKMKGGHHYKYPQFFWKFGVRVRVMGGGEGGKAIPRVAV
jgi:hypothetical protein